LLFRGRGIGKRQGQGQSEVGAGAEEVGAEAEVGAQNVSMLHIAIT
jgi:hypothetical protein